MIEMGMSDEASKKLMEFGIEIKSNEEEGRGFYSTKKIEIGKKVSEDAPYIYTLSKGRRENRCCYCFNECKPKKCSICKIGKKKKKSCFFCYLYLKCL